jgi:hypothetical protein
MLRTVHLPRYPWIRRQLGGVPKSMSTADFAKFIVGETEKWAKVVRFGNIKMD